MRGRFLARAAAPIAAALLWSAGLFAVAASPAVESVAPAMAPQDVSAYCAADFSQLTALVVGSASTSAPGLTTPTSTKTGTVYVRVTSRDTASACNAFYRYHGLAYATNASGSSGVMDWGLLVKATTTPGNQCWITTTSTDEIMHATNSTSCPSGASSPLAINLSQQGMYHNNSSPNSAGDYFLVHTSCSTVYQSGTTGETVKTGVSMSSTTAGNPGANCHALDTDALGNSQTFYYDAGLPTVSFSAPATSTTSGNTTVTYTAADALSGISSWSLSRQKATLSNDSCGTFADETSVDTGMSAVTGQSNAQNGLTVGCYKWYLDATDNAGNNATRVYSNVVKIDPTAPSAPSVTSSDAAWEYRTGNTIYFRQQSGSTLDLTADSSDAQTTVASSTFGTYTGVNGGSFNGTVSGDPAVKTITFWSDNAGGTLPVISTDSAGNDSSATTLTFTRDDTAPAFNGFTAPTSQVNQTGSTYTFTYNASTDGGSGFATYHRVLQSAPFSGGACGSWTNLSDLGNSTSTSYAASGFTNGTCYRLAVAPIDNVGNGGSTWSYSAAVVRNSIPTLVVTDDTSGPDEYRSGNTIFFKGGAAGSVTLTADGSTTSGTITDNTFGALTGTPTGWSPTTQQSSATDPYAVTYSWGTTSPSTSTSVTTTNSGGETSLPTVITFTPDSTAPAISFSAPAAGGPVDQSGTSFTVTFTATDGGSGFARSGAGWSLQRQIASATAGACGTFADDTASGNLMSGQTSAAGQTSEQTLVHDNCYRWVLSAMDSVGNDATTITSGAILVDTSAPSAPAVTSNAPAGSYRTGNTIYFRPTAAGTITLTSTGADAESDIASSTFGALSASTGWTYTSGTVAGNPANKNLTWSSTAVSATLPVTTTNGAGAASSATTITFTADSTAPTTSISLPASGGPTYQNTTAYTVTFIANETGSGFANGGDWELQRQSAVGTNGACGTFANDTNATYGANWLVTGTSASASNQTSAQTLTTGRCYRWILNAGDAVGNNATAVTSGSVMIDTTNPASPALSSNNPAGSYMSGNTIWFRPAATGTIILTATGTDNESGIASNTYGTLSPTTGWTYTSGLVTGNPTTKNLIWASTAVSASMTVWSTNKTNTTGTATTLTLTADSTAPAAASNDFTNPPAGSTVGLIGDNDIAWNEVDNSGGSGIGSRSVQRWKSTATKSGTGDCAAAAYATDGSAVTTAPPSTQSLTASYCYKWVMTITDRVGNSTTGITSGYFWIQPAPPAPGTPDLDTASDSGPIARTTGSVTVRPDGDVSKAGNVTYSSGTSAWNLIDETTLDTGDYIRTSQGANVVLSFTDSNLATSDIINSVKLHIDIANGAPANSGHLAVRDPATGTDYVVIELGQNNNIKEVWLGTRPWDGQPWTKTDIDAMQLDVLGNDGGLGNMTTRQLYVDVAYTTFATPSAYTADNVTNDDTPSFSGTNDVSATSVQLFSDGVLVGTDSTVSSGVWNITSSSLTDGAHAITAKAVNGGASAPSTAINVTIDTTAPAAPSAPDMAASADTGVSNTDNITSNRKNTDDNAGGNLTTGTFTADGTHHYLAPVIVSNAALTPYVSWNMTYTGYSGRMSAGMTCNGSPGDPHDDNTSSGVPHKIAFSSGTQCQIYAWANGGGTFTVTGGTYSYHDASAVEALHFTGTGPADAKVIALYDDGVLVGADSAPAAGTTYDVGSARTLVPGTRNFTAKTYDQAGNLSVNASPALGAELVDYLPALKVGAPVNTVVGATNYFSAATIDEIGQPITSQAGKTITITTTDAGAVFPEGNTYQMLPSDQEFGHTFKVLFSAAGTYTVTVSAPQVVPTTYQVTVAAGALRAAAPATVYQNIPFKMAVMPRISSKTSGPINKAYGATVTFSSSDAAATFGTEVDANKKYTFICNCDGAHLFATKLTQLGNQTLTVTDQFGTTDTITVNVVAAPSGGIDPISRIDALQWPQGNHFDYYITATGNYELVFVQDNCGLSNRPLSESGPSVTTPSLGNGVNGGILAMAADPASSFNQGILPANLTSDTYTSGQIWFKVDAALCGPGGFSENRTYTFFYTDGLGHMFSRNTVGGPEDVWRVFGDIPGNANFDQQGPDSPIISWSIVSRGPAGASTFYNPGTHGVGQYSPKAISAQFNLRSPMQIWKLVVNADDLMPYEFGQGMEFQSLPKGTTTTRLDDAPFKWLAGCAGYRTNTAGHIYIQGADGSKGALSGGLGFLGATAEPPPPAWPCDMNAEEDANDPNHNTLRDALNRLGLNGLTSLMDAASNISHMTVGDPVDALTGGQHGDVTDFSLGGKTPFLTFERHYRGEIAELAAQDLVSENLTYTTLGRGWASNLDWRLDLRDAKTITVRGAEGNASDFNKRDDGTWGAPLGLKMTLTESGGGYLLKRDTGDGYRFNSAGKLQAIFDTKGHEMTVAYDGSGFVDSFTDTVGRTADVTVNAAGNITRIDLPDGRYVAYTYNSDGYLASARGLDGNTMSYTTDRRGRMTQIKDPDGHVVLANTYDGKGRVIAQSDALGNVSNFVYDRTLEFSTLEYGPRGDLTITCFNPDGTVKASLNAVDQRRSYTYNDKAQMTSAVDEVGARYRYHYDANGNMTKVIDPLGNAVTTAYNANNQIISQTGADGTTITTAYDAGTGLPTSTTTSDGTHSLQTAAYTYNAWGQPLTMSGPGGQTTTFTYDSRGYMDSMTDPMGNKTTYVTDARGFVTSSVDPLGNVAGGTPSQHTTSYTYDNAGRILTVTNPLNQTTTYTYDAMGHVKTSLTPLGGLTTNTYDLKGQLLSVNQSISAGVSSTTTYEYDAAGHLTATVDGENRRTEATYDLLGRVLTNKDELDKISTMTYDGKGRVIKQTDPTGKSISTTYDILGRALTATDTAGKSTTFTYWATTEQIKTITDPLNHTTTYHYDWLGRQDSVTNAKNQTSSATYDNAGNVLSVTNARNKTTSFTYNANNQLLTVVEPGDSGNITTTYGYDNVGRLHTKTNGRNAVETYDYDALGRLALLTDAAGKQWQTFYDADGRVDHTIDGKGVTTSFGYDLAGRLTSVTPASPLAAMSYTYDKTGRVSQTTDGNGTTVYGYDAAGRVTSVARGGRTTGYGYDDAGRRTTVTYPGALGAVVYTYDAAGRPSTITDWSNRITTYHYDDASRVTSVDRPGGLTTTYTYDELDRPLTAVSVRSSTTILSQDWTYDANGNIATLTDDTGTASMTYDNLDRLLTANYPSAQNYTYTYDAVGNTTQAITPAGTTNYTYDLADRITSGTTAPTYDDNGNMLTDGSYGGRTYTYDTLGRLATVTIGGVTTDYTLDGQGNRTSQVTSGVTTTFDLDRSGRNATVMYDGTNKFLPGAPGAGYEASGTWHNSLVDQVGSPILTVSNTGTVSGATHYGPYGAPRPGSTAAVGIGYAGEYRDATGLINLRARSYDPVLGRFIGRDTFGGVASAPQTGNRYAYASSNPFRYTDPSGHFVQAVIDNAPTIISFGLMMVPVVGTAYMGFQAVTGYDPITGHHLSDTERLIMGAAAVAGIATGAFAMLARGGEEMGMAAKGADEAASAFRSFGDDIARAGESDASIMARTVDRDWPVMGSLGHSGRVSEAMTAAAKHYGLSGEEVATWGRLGMLHDVGKSGDVASAMRPLEAKPFAEMSGAEKEILSAAQAEHERLGAEILEQAGFSEDFWHSVAHHGNTSVNSDLRSNVLQIMDGLDAKARTYAKMKATEKPATSWAEAARDFEVKPDNTAMNEIWSSEGSGGLMDWVLGGGLNHIQYPSPY